MLISSFLYNSIIRHFMYTEAAFFSENICLWVVIWKSICIGSCFVILGWLSQLSFGSFVWYIFFNFSFCFKCLLVNSFAHSILDSLPLFDNFHPFIFIINTILLGLSFAILSHIFHLLYFLLCFPFLFYCFQIFSCPATGEKIHCGTSMQENTTQQ